MLELLKGLVIERIERIKLLKGYDHLVVRFFHELNPGNERLLIPSHILGIYSLPSVPVLGGT